MQQFSRISKEVCQALFESLHGNLSSFTETCLSNEKAGEDTGRNFIERIGMSTFLQGNNAGFSGLVFGDHSASLFGERTFSELS